MELINDEINIKEMYKFQLEKLENEEYNKYLKYLNVFYMKDQKKEKYIKKYVDNKYVLIDKQIQSKKIIIIPSEYININNLYIELNKYSEELLIKISNIIESKNNITDENRNEFDFLKKKYLIFQEKLNDINIIKEEYHKELDILINNKVEKIDDLIKFYKKRNIDYSNIKESINRNLKNNLIKVFKETGNKIPSIIVINKIAKENLIASNEIEKWFQWIESVYFYMLIKIEIKILNENINKKEEIFYMDTNYMIIKKPIINEK